MAVTTTTAVDPEQESSVRGSGGGEAGPADTGLPTKGGAARGQQPGPLPE